MAPPERRHRTWAAWLLATALHGAALGGLARLPRGPAPIPPPPAGDAGELAFDLAEPEAPPSTPGTTRFPERDEPPRASAPATGARARAAAVATDDAARGSAPEGEPAENAPAGEPGPRAGVTILAPDPEAIGIGRRNTLLGGTPGSATPAVDETSEARRRAVGSLVAPLEARDRELGLLPDGPVRTAVASAVSVSLAPVRGRAVMRARIDAEGRVTALEVEDTEGGRSGWIDAAEKALAALRTARLRMPARAKGGSLRLEVTSAWKLPSGQDPGTTVTVAGVPVHRGEGKDSAQLRLLDLPKLVTVELAPGVKVQIPMVQVNLATVTTDPSNLGAQARRVVHTRLLDAAWD